MPVLDTPAGPLELIERGDGAELWVLAHASATGPRALLALADALARPGRRFVLPALEGYGATRLDAPDTVAANALAVRAALEHGQAARRVLFGHSMGGLAAVHAVESGAPLNALALYEPILVGALRRDDAEDMQLLDWDRRIIANLHECVADGRPADGVARFVEGWNEVRWASLPDTVRERLTASAPLLVRETADTARASAPVTRLVRDAIPVCLAVGDRSPPLSMRMATRFAQAHGAINVHTVAGAGHMAPMLDAGPNATLIERTLGQRG